jgi:hypothetical protein
MVLRATLDEDPRSRIQGNRAILLEESHKLDPWPLDEGPRPKRWQIQAKSTWHHFGEKNQSVQTQKKKEAKAESS